MAERRYVHVLAPIARKHVARTERELLPAKLRELVERLHEAEAIRDPRERPPRTRRDAAPRTGEQMRPRAPLAAAGTGTLKV